MGGVPCLLYAPYSTSVQQHQVATVCHAVLCLPCDALFPLQAAVYHASTVYQAGLCMPYSPRFTIQSSVYRIPLCLPIRPLLTMRRSVSFAGRCLPCSHLFAMQATVYRVAICLPHTPLLTAPPLQALPQHSSALPALCITSHHTATSPLQHQPLLHLKAYDVPACLL